MDMKKILQTMNSISTKPVVGADSMARFLRVVREAEINQPAAPAMATSAPPAGTSPGVSLDNADAFKDSLKKQSGGDPEIDATIDRLVAYDFDGTIDADQTMLNLVKEFTELMPTFVNFIKWAIGAMTEFAKTPEFQQATPEDQKSLLDSVKDLQAQLPAMEKQVADMQAQSAREMPAAQQKVDQKANDRFKAKTGTDMVRTATGAKTNMGTVDYNNPNAKPIQENSLSEFLRVVREAEINQPTSETVEYLPPDPEISAQLRAQGSAAIEADRPKQQADAFIRYSSGMYDPSTLPKTINIKPGVTLPIKFNPIKNMDGDVLANAIAANKLLPPDLQYSQSELSQVVGQEGTQEDISFNGATQHDNGDMSYQAGPLSVRKNKDGSSDTTATIGDTTARVQQNPIGVKTITAQGPAADAVNSADASADRKRVDPAKFLAFQKQLPANESMDRFLSIVKKNDVGILNEGSPHKVSLPVQMAMQHYQQTKETHQPRERLIDKYFVEAETEITQRKEEKRALINQYAKTIAERVLMKESAQAVSETPIEMTGDPNDPHIYGHEKANPMSLKGRIGQARAQLKELAELAESDSLLAWEEICKKAKGGMFMGLEQNLEQIRHGISELAAKRRKGGVASRGIHPSIGEGKRK